MVNEAEIDNLVGVGGVDILAGNGRTIAGADYIRGCERHRSKQWHKLE